MQIQGRVFVVTGAGGGIGGELAGLLLEHGATVVAVDYKPDLLDTLRTKLKQHDNNLSTHVCDISDRHAVTDLVKEINKTRGEVDGLINCAGIIQPFVMINDLDYTAIDHVINVNFYGLLHMTKAFLPQLLERPEACVVNYSSMGGFLPVPGQGIYGASKAAVKLLSEALYAELRGTNVHVCTVFPGATQTDIAKNSDVSIDVDADSSKFPMLSANDSARQVIKAIEKNKPRVLTGKDAKAMDKLYRLNPIFATKFIAKQMSSLLNKR